MRRLVWGAALAVSVMCADQKALGSDPSGNFRFLRLDGHHVKWGDPALGTGATVRYAFLTEPAGVSGAVNCRSMAPLGGLLATSAIAPDVFEREAAAAFALWQAAANIKFARVARQAEADILIGAETSPRVRRAHADVAYASAGDGATRSIARALICLDPARPWKIGFGGEADAYDVRYTLAHEIGHAIGLDHAGATGELMSFSYDEAFRVLQPGDIGGAALLYGPRPTVTVAGDPARGPGLTTAVQAAKTLAPTVPRP